MSESLAHPVLLLVSRRAKPGHEAEFEWLMAEFISAAEAFHGCLGAQLVHPGDEEAVEDTLYHAVMAFDNPISREAWQQSAERAVGLASIAPHIEGPTVVRGISGLAHCSTGEWQQKWAAATLESGRCDLARDFSNGVCALPAVRGVSCPLVLIGQDFSLDRVGRSHHDLGDCAAADPLASALALSLTL